MEPTIYKPSAYKSPGIYKGAGGIYNGSGIYKLESKKTTKLIFSTDFSNAYLDGEYLRGVSNEGIEYSIRYAKLNNGKAQILNTSGDKFFPFSSVDISQLLNPKICVKYSVGYGGSRVYAWISPNSWGNDMFELGPAFSKVCMIKNNSNTNFFTPVEEVTSNLRYRLTQFDDSPNQINEYAIKRNDDENKNQFFINGELVFDCDKSNFNMNNFFGLQNNINAKIGVIEIYADV